ncbi:hypothetical protein WICPIJ_003965 [Wickerhamomyces pijperi]|uniref:3-oxoacyl-[acyl-carrier-protein] reductase n=1 Tax=Wickerhamomyces pijperi TaxID=599730 RepID=A0A9P8Q6J3_WICPI|nr:hypothetical protein WICPIJ_003965 [Wickerhamomyces pijperi]
MSGKTIFITGGNKGIGYQLVSLLSSDSSNVILVAIRDVNSPSAALAQLVKDNSKIKLVQLELSHQEDIDSIPNQIDSILGKDAAIDLFLSNAGIGDDMEKTIEATDAKKWQRHYHINSLAPILTFQKIYPYLKRSQYKQAVFTSSILGSIGDYYPTSTAAYGQSKAALNYTVKALSEELKEEGFAIVAIHPGVVATDLLKESGLELGGYNVITEKEAAERQIVLFKKLSKEFNGKFWDASSDKELTW